MGAAGGGFLGLLACLITAGLLTVGSALGASGTISTVAGDGTGTFDGDGGPASLASLNYPEGVSATSDGGFLIADKENHRIRRVAPDGTISTVAGNGLAGLVGDNLLATAAKLNAPEGVAALLDGGFLIADTGNCRIRRVSPLGTITTVAGTSCGHSGDGGLATLAKLTAPRAAVPTPDGGFLIADTGNHVVRRVSPLGIISTVAGDGDSGSDGDGDSGSDGDGDSGSDGDGGPATSASLGAPDDVSPTPDGGFLVADTTEHVVRRVSADGRIATVAGNSSNGGSSGDGGPATAALLDTPTDVEALPGGGFLVADHDRDRVRHVRASGLIVNFAGTGQNGFAGDGGPGAAANLHGPHALSLTPDGDVLIADSDNHRIRRVDADLTASDDGDAADQGQGGNGEGQGNGEPQTEAPYAPDAGEPVLGRSVVVAPAFGSIKVKQPGDDEWTSLEGGVSLPVGTVVNARRGSVVLTSAITGGDGSQTGTFWAGVFRVGQAQGGNGMTEIHLHGGDFRRCRRARRSATTAVASRRRGAVRRLWAKDDNGRFRTHGRDSVATTRGTVWVTADRCNGTLTRVLEGQVRVRPRHSSRGVLVSAGERHLARRR